MINFCIMNNLSIMNTFYNYKNIHKLTKEMTSTDDRFMIYYIIVNNSYKKQLTDTRVRRGAKLYTDHYFVLAKIKIETDRRVYKSSRRKKEYADVRNNKYI